MGRFAKALVNLISSTVRASSALMERGAERMSGYADKHEVGPPPDAPTDS
jgi:hypothetical protein